MADREYRLNRFRGGWAVVWNEPDGSRPRHKLNADNRQDAEREKARFIAEVERPAHITVRYLWGRYREENAHKRLASNMKWSGIPILEAFGDGRPEDVTTAACREYIAKREKQGRKPGTIWTELNHLQVVLNWARKHRLIREEIAVQRPSKPPPRDRRLTRREAVRLLNAAHMPHIRLAIALMIGTGARAGAVLDLTWDRVDLERGLISYARHEPGVRRKGRATVPIVPDLLERLKAARKAAVTDYVIEWAGEKVASIKKGFASAVVAAKLKNVTPHVLRHSVATWMAEDGRPMTEIAAVLGHTDSRTTERIYAKFSPTYLRSTVAVLDMSGVLSGSDDLESENGD